MKNLLRTFTLNLALLASTPAAALAQTAEEERVVKDLIPANSASTMRGDWRIEGKELVQLGKTPTTLFFGNKNWGDFNLEVDC